MDVRPPADDAHTAQSSTREKIVEHLFVGELLRHLWQRGVRDIEVLRAEVDKGGYDLVLEANGTMRHVQLKSSHRTAKTPEVNINIALARKPSGCILWIFFDPTSLELGPFLWFGARAGGALPPLGDRIGTHTKRDSAGVRGYRQNIRVLRKSQFDRCPP